MKKLLLTLGAVASVAAPVAAVVACSGQVDDAINKLKDGYKDDIIKYGASLSADEKAALLVKVNAIKDTASNSELLKDPAMKNIMVAKAAASTTTGTTTAPKAIAITLQSSMTDAQAIDALKPFTDEATKIATAVGAAEKAFPIGDDAIYSDAKNMEFLKAFAEVTISLDGKTFVYNPYNWYAAFATKGDSAHNPATAFDNAFSKFVSDHKGPGVKYFEH